jgi:hypothetical protein
MKQLHHYHDTDPNAYQKYMLSVANPPQCSDILGLSPLLESIKMAFEVSLF